MTPLQTHYYSFFNRSLGQLKEQLDGMPEEQLWQTKAGIINPCGVLVQHLVGNLNHYIGTALGHTGYVRKRDEEFRKSDKTKEELLQAIADLQEMLKSLLPSLEADDFSASYPAEFPFECTTEEALVHLHGHLSYHLGQFNYLRRMLDKKG